MRGAAASGPPPKPWREGAASARHAFHAVAPDTLIRALAEATTGQPPRRGSRLTSSPSACTGPTARWAAGAMRARTSLDKQGGFHVEPLEPGKGLGFFEGNGRSGPC